MRKITRGVVALLVGALAAFAPAAAASATEVSLTGKASDCTPRGWTASWTFTNKSRVPVKVESLGSSVDADITISKPMPVLLNDGEAVTFTTLVPTRQATAALRVDFRHKLAHSFSELKSEREWVKTCCKVPGDNPTSPGPSGSPSAEPSGPPSSGSPSKPPESTPPSSQAPSSPPPAGDDEQPPADGSGGGDTLPLTGAPVAGAVGVGAVLLIGGLVAVLAVRRRRRFEA